jgi:hypothetical protein
MSSVGLHTNTGNTTLMTVLFSRSGCAYPKPWVQAMFLCGGVKSTSREMVTPTHNYACSTTQTMDCCLWSPCDVSRHLQQFLSRIRRCLISYCVVCCPLRGLGSGTLISKGPVRSPQHKQPLEPALLLSLSTPLAYPAHNKQSHTIAPIKHKLLLNKASPVRQQTSVNNGSLQGPSSRFCNHRHSFNLLRRSSRYLQHQRPDQRHHHLHYDRRDSPC